MMPIGTDGKTLIQSYTLQAVNKIGVTESPFSFAQQIQDYLAERWEGTITTKPLYGADARNMRGFLNSLRGRKGTFQAAIPQDFANDYSLFADYDPYDQYIQIQDYAATPSFDLDRGIYFQLGTAGDRRLFMMQEDYNGSTYTQNSIFPRVGQGYYTNYRLYTTNPIGTFRLTDNNTAFSVDVTEGHSFSFAFESII